MVQNVLILIFINLATFSLKNALCYEGVFLYFSYCVAVYTHNIIH